MNNLNTTELQRKVTDLEYEKGIKKLEERFKEIVRDFHGHPKFLEIVGDIVELHSQKNKQYAGKSDPLGNFRRGSNIIYKLLSPNFRDDEFRKQIAYALCLVSKQIDGAVEIIGESKENTFDSLYEKLRDCMVYFGIMMAMEKMREQSVKDNMEKECVDKECVMELSSTKKQFVSYENHFNNREDSAKCCKCNEDDDMA